MRESAMQMKFMSFLAMIAGLMILGLSTDGYGPCPVSAQSQTGESAIRVEGIGVMPFLKGRCGSDVGEILDCPLRMLSFDPENVLPGSDRNLTGYLHEVLKERHGERVIPLAEMVNVYDRIAKDDAQDTPRTVAQKLGGALKTDLIFAGAVWRYRERVGRPAGAASPASVGFAVYLIEVTSGKMLWSGKFAETQQALSDNVLDTWAFVKKGAKWLSANELARYGVKEVLKKSPL